MRGNARTISIVNYGGKPNTRSDHSPIVYSMLEDIKRLTEGKIIIDFPKGVYHFYPDCAPKRAFHTSNTDTIRHPIKTVCFLIEHVENVTIEGNGSMFIFHGDVMGLGIFHSKNIHLKNLSWDYEVSTLSELVVQSTYEKDDHFYADCRINENFLYEIRDQKYFYWLSEKSPYTNEYYWEDEDSKNDMVIVGFDETSGVKRRFAVNEGPFAENKMKIEEHGKGNIRIFYDQSLPKAIVPNRVFEFCKVIDRNTAGALIWESEEISFEQVTIHYLHGFGFLIQMSGDISFAKTHFIPNEALGKHGSSFADSIHVSGAKGKIIIDNCNFAHPHDDPINIHGTFTRVEKIIDEYSIEVKYAHHQQAGFPQYHIGDKVAFFNRRTMGEDFEEYEVKDVTHPGQNGNDLKTMQVTFDKKLPFEYIQSEIDEFLYVMENVTYTPEVIITNNTFAHIPTRGILCTTRRKVLIEKNNFQNITMSTIFISNDSNDWYESGPVRDMTIRGNIFDITPVEGWNDRKPAIHIHPIPLGEEISPVAIHKNITIEDNIFFMHHESVVLAENVENLIIRNNKIINMEGKNVEENRLLYEFNTCKNVILTKNTYKRFKNVSTKIRGMKDRDIHNDDQITIMKTNSALKI
ncbi:right-handed parallel beta-helix repeat-containing protein [Lederbergia wuyishanensis]|uniref:GLAA-B beta-barrel domain-containing protein n=1 Tax=Lederbergia wuyishanensis TaxID=1347903 RepID=A0ABU0D444_9BACI|nr:right-handed parallel beta-helix repeat-containing protein [Lederbergia wuyishanensis]MCJ8008252.1 right-handed parallel beta-helix repeat-containing protein [Lederbergia wuyishanensis]MDQ0343159.1 hypothetical protein [Lederbergia wuyishanensis]